MALNAEDQATFAAHSGLESLCEQFEQNVLSATDHWTLPVSDVAQLNGLPRDAPRKRNQPQLQRKRWGIADVASPMLFGGDALSVTWPFDANYRLHCRASAKDGFDNACDH